MGAKKKALSAKSDVGGIPADYAATLRSLKKRIADAQVRAALRANREMLALYWDIGRTIADKQEDERWGARVVDRLAEDLSRAFPGVSGLSRANLYRMRAFYAAHPEEIVAQPVRRFRTGKTSPEIVAQPVRQMPASVADLPWGHHVVLLQRVSDTSARAFYATTAVSEGWSRPVLELQIEQKLHARQGKAITNFAKTLPAPNSDLAQQVLKDPYIFDFLTLAKDAQERDLEQGLIDHVQKFLVELGVGFAFVGRQVHLRVGDQDFYLDLLFYHLKLRCFFVVDLKVVPFVPEFAGKMNFYLSAVDAEMRHPTDAPTIGLLLCKGKNKLVVEYALRDVKKPIGVAEWETRIVESLPKELRGKLPSVAEIEAELATR